MNKKQDRSVCEEELRLEEDASRENNWKRWGPYLSERQWGTVREDYSPDGTCWDYFPHDHARSRAYRWGEDGILGICDRECRLCFSVALWNGKDPILKERLFGLTNSEGNHGEDVKELYSYLDSTPTHSYMKALYRYPQDRFPYERIVEENLRRGIHEMEFELAHTGIFNSSRYFDVYAEYAKASPDDILIKITVFNRGGEKAALHMLPTLWFRNTWIWGCRHEGCTLKPQMGMHGANAVRTSHGTLGELFLHFDPKNCPGGTETLFTENETNTLKLHGTKQYTKYVKDAFHECVINGNKDAVNPDKTGTKAAIAYRIEIPGGESSVLKLRLTREKDPERLFGPEFEEIFTVRATEADRFYAKRIPAGLDDKGRQIARNAYSALLWTKQFYHIFVADWLKGDPSMPPPPPTRHSVRNSDWEHLFCRDVISMPDKWEYPWFAAWDLAFHMIPMANVDADFAKNQLILFLREWYMHPNGQIPAYEFNFNDVNPPVHAWACWRVYKICARNGCRDYSFLASAFQKLLMNFTWWVNRKDEHGRHIFSGGFLGLDNIGVFDRSKPLPGGGHLEQADATAWMAFYAGTMLSIAIELASHDKVYEDMASKFFEHFIAIADAMNNLGGSGLWDEEDGFYYDRIDRDGVSIPLKVRSMVGLMPLIAAEVIEGDAIDKLTGFKRRMQWFLDNRKDLSSQIAFMSGEHDSKDDSKKMLLAIPCKNRLLKVLSILFDEEEFLSPFGFRSLSKRHLTEPFSFFADGTEHRVDYIPGESNTWLFGGNSNWRGPVWFPVNYLILEALERYHLFYGETLKIEFPTGSGKLMSLGDIAAAIHARLCSIFIPDEHGKAPCHGDDPRFQNDPHWKNIVSFNEYFHGETGRGLGALQQAGWTSLVTSCLAKSARGVPENQ
ncbi:MAG: hypothetical protein JW808_06880 [Victivallales bacterium]|nr:hypothetical protein [Victivallales bacterium]